VAVPQIFLASLIVLYSSNLYNFFVAEDLDQAWTTTPAVVAHMFFPGVGGYRPLMFVFWWLGDLLWGYQPVGYRLASLGLHLVNACLVYSLARYLSKRTSIGLLAGLLFMSLAPSADAVNWLSAASNLLPGVLGYLLALRAYLALRSCKPSESGHRLWLYGLCIGSLLLALGSQELALTWPFVALLVGWYVQCPDLASLDRSRRLQTCFEALRRELKMLSPMIGVWAVFIIWRTIAVKGIGGYGVSVHLRAGWFLIDDVWAYIQFLTSPLADTGLGRAFFTIVTTTPMAGLVTLLVLIALLWPVRWTLLLTVIMLLPALNIPKAHRAYFAGVGYALVWAFVALKLISSDRLRTGVLIVAVSGLLFFHAIGGVERSAAWTASSRLVTYILSEVRRLEPLPPNGTRFYFADLPKKQQDAYAFTWGLREGIQASYHNRTLDAYRVTVQPDPDLVNYRLEIALDQLPPNSPETSAVYLVYADDILQRVTRTEFTRRVASH
jgi:hypothetical protein